MADNTTPKKRSAVMSRIKGKNTKPEIVLRKALWAAGLRYRLHAKTPVGRPDIVFPGPKVAVFVDGCFWHGCPDHYVRPRSRPEFWAAKLRENVERDIRQTGELEDAGWRVLRFWEHQVFTEVDEVVETVAAAVRDDVWRAAERWLVVEVAPIDERGVQERRSLVELRGLRKMRTQQYERHTRKWKRAP